MKSTATTISEVLRAAILESGLSAYRIARETGLDHRSIGRFLSGESALRLDSADRIAARLGVVAVVIPERLTRRD